MFHIKLITLYIVFLFGFLIIFYHYKFSLKLSNSYLLKFSISEGEIKCCFSVSLSELSKAFPSAKTRSLKLSLSRLGG